MNKVFNIINNVQGIIAVVDLILSYIFYSELNLIFCFDKKGDNLTKIIDGKVVKYNGINIPEECITQAEK